jgi:ATP-dependent phosphoenolpyruvate carboxykinase
MTPEQVASMIISALRGADEGAVAYYQGLSGIGAIPLTKDLNQAKLEGARQALLMFMDRDETPA